MTRVLVTVVATALVVIILVAMAIARGSQDTYQGLSRGLFGGG